MKNKIAIIGAGLFGITTYIILKKNNFDCTLFEKNKNFLLRPMSLPICIYLIGKLIIRIDAMIINKKQQSPPHNNIIIFRKKKPNFIWK